MRNFLLWYTLYPEFLYPVCVKSGVVSVIAEEDSFSSALLTALENCPRNVIPGIRQIRNSLYPVCFKSGIICVIAEEDSLALFTGLKNSPRKVISGIRYIRNSLYPVCGKSGMGCVVITGIRYIGFGPKYPKEGTLL